MSALLHHTPSLCAPPDEGKPLRVDASLFDALDELPPYTNNVWGPAEWIAGENTILGLPDVLSEAEFCLFRVYLALKARFMTCPNCQRHFRAALEAMPNDRLIRTRAGLLAWWTGLHNEVNARRHQHVLTSDEIVASLRSRATDAARVSCGAAAAADAADSKKKSTGSTWTRGILRARWGLALAALVLALGVVAFAAGRRLERSRMVGGWMAGGRRIELGRS